MSEPRWLSTEEMKAWRGFIEVVGRLNINLEADTNLFGAIATRAFAEEITFQTEDAYWEGTGSGQPLGIMNAPCKVTVSKENGQATKTIVYENVLNMYSRMWARSRPNAVWFINQDIDQAIFTAILEKWATA